MAIYHFHAKVISRANGSSAVAAAAYRAACRLEDERLGRAQDFSNKSGVIHSEIMAPEGAPERWQDRQTLWNEVEAGEKRKDAQLAREVEFSIPREMTPAQGVALAREFVQREFVDRGMVADLNVHWDKAADGSSKPHAHVMLSMREISPDGSSEGAGFGKKVREWNANEQLNGWREGWANHVNERLAKLDIDARIDHRSYKAQGIELEPQHKIGPAGMRREERGEDAERALEHREISRRNGEKIIAEPSVALDAITRQQSTFTEHDLMRFVHRHSDDAEQFGRVLSAVKASPNLVAMGLDGQGKARFSTREMIETERRLERSAETLASRGEHGISATTNRNHIAAAERRGLTLGEEQRDALAHITSDKDLSLLVGYAGTGKSAMLGVAREAWESHGYTVRGAALSGIAAESLEGGSGIGSRTIASLEHAWGQGRDALTASDILVIDEAGMIGSRQMDRVLAHAAQAGAKVVLVGDPEQLQAIEAGAAFRALTERHGAAEITQIRRQHEDWQKAATRELATGRTGEALERYEAAGMVHGHETKDAARSALVAGWDAVRQVKPEASQVMLAHTRVDVATLNTLARERMREGGQLGDEVVLQVERGERAFAPGDRAMFLKNERSLGVKNGSLGTIERIAGTTLTVRLDGAEKRSVQFDVKDYANIDHGYASTIHKSQGVTVDHGHLLATSGLDRHAAYVGMSRHRSTLAVHYGSDDFKDRQQLVRTLGRERAKDTTLDYATAFAERRGLERAVGPVDEPVRAKSKSLFATFKPKPALERAPAVEKPSLAAPEVAPSMGKMKPELVAPVSNFARAFADAERMGAAGLPVLPHQEAALRQAEQAMAAVNPFIATDLRTALSAKPGLAAQIDKPGGLDKIRAGLSGARTERRDLAQRADKFVERWSEARKELKDFQHRPSEREVVEKRMNGMAKALARDPKLEAALSPKRDQLGLSHTPPGLGLAKALSWSFGLGPSISR
ncbi:MAG: Ti-type conjugative transfer relaxase TraA [Caulobacteraceae bacterium]